MVAPCLGQRRDERIHCPFLSGFHDYNNTLDSKILEVCLRAIDNMTAWLMVHGPIPSFQKYLLEPARLSSPGLVYGKYAQEAVSLTKNIGASCGFALEPIL